jgi:hypothetical protein
MNPNFTYMYGENVILQAWTIHSQSETDLRVYTVFVKYDMKGNCDVNKLIIE